MLAAATPRAFPAPMANAAYTTPISTRPLPTNMRQHSTLQRRQFKPMDVPRNQDLVELCPEKFAAFPAPTWPTLPTPPPFQRGLYRRICASTVPSRGVNLSLWTSLAIKIWWRYGLKWSLPPPPRWPSHLISLASDPGLYRRLCGGITHPRSVN
jgi:hypothetical protein